MKARQRIGATAALLLAFSLGTGGCGRDSEVATYRLAGNLVADTITNCGECSAALVLDAVRVDDPSRRVRFPLEVGDDVGFQFRWGVEQVVEIERTYETVRPGVADDTGVRERIVRVVEQHPVAAGTRFQMRFGWPPGASSIAIERDGAAVRVRDYRSAMLLLCPDPAVCDTIASTDPGAQAFTVDLAYSPDSDAVLTAYAVRVSP